MALPLLLSYHGNLCQSDYSCQDSLLTNTLFVGDMFFLKKQPEPSAGGLFHYGSVPESFWYKEYRPG